MALVFTGDYMSPSRFVRATFFENYSDKPTNGQEVVTLTTHILDTVDIPKVRYLQKMQMEKYTLIQRSG